MTFCVDNNVLSVASYKRSPSMHGSQRFSNPIIYVYHIYASSYNTKLKSKPVEYASIIGHIGAHIIIQYTIPLGPAYASIMGIDTL